MYVYMYWESDTERKYIAEVFAFFLFGQFHILVLLQLKQCLCADCSVIEVCILFYVVGLFHV